jgi:hypothetical protein
MLASLNRIRASLLGGLAALAVFCFCVTLGGFAWLCVAIFFIGDHEASDIGAYGPSAVFALSLLAGCLLSCRFGRKVGRDWYSKGY